MLRLASGAIRAGAVLLVVTGLAVLAAETMALRGFPPEALDRVDALIVLGGGVDPDQELNYIGRGRADMAARLLAEDKAGAAILTGTLNDPQRPGGEAALMRARAHASGAPTEALITEPKARTTLENLTLSFAVGEARGFQSYAIVTDAFHLPRARALAALLGRADVAGVATDSVTRGTGFMRLGIYAREAMAWWYNLYKAAAWTTLDILGVPEAERTRYVV